MTTFADHLFTATFTNAPEMISKLMNLFNFILLIVIILIAMKHNTNIYSYNAFKHICVHNHNLHTYIIYSYTSTQCILALIQEYHIPMSCIPPPWVGRSSQHLNTSSNHLPSTCPTIWTPFSSTQHNTRYILFLCLIVPQAY